jgi:hypothetical protein
MPWKPEICSLQKLLTSSQKTFHSCAYQNRVNISTNNHYFLAVFSFVFANASSV